MQNRKNKGITLIALVVTIIVLLILAGISISMLTGQNGILNRASEAKEKTEIASEDEKRKLAQAEALMNTEKITYKGVTLPEGFAPTKIEGEDSIDEGLVITDGYGNEYVWVEVPKTNEVYPTAGLNVIAFTGEEYVKIENDLHTYTSDYRNETEYKDVYYADSADGWFKNEAEYNELKYKMLKSIYQNCGFWIGRYEAGISENRKSAGDATNFPMSKANIYPYNYVTRTQAKVLAEKVESGSYTSSLLFGVQWDLTLKYIENKKIATDSEIKTKLNSDSETIGNYKNNLWNIKNTLAKYSTDNGNTYVNCPYQKKSENSVLLTTGASEEFAVMNIYDIAGNVWEWTLEKAVGEYGHCAGRGGVFESDGNGVMASFRANISASDRDCIIGFRISIY